MGLKSLLGIGKEVAQPIEAIGNTFDKVFTSDEERLQAQIILEKLALKPQILQGELNKIEAQHTSLLVSGWRPAIGWTCAAGLAWHFILYPAISFITYLTLALLNKNITLPVQGDAEDLMKLVYALLGLGIYRTFEKVAGKAK